MQQSLVQVWNAEDAYDEVLAMVVRTGLITCMGSMVRHIISPSYERKEKDPFVQVSTIALLIVQKIRSLIHHLLTVSSVCCPYCEHY